MCVSKINPLRQHGHYTSGQQVTRKSHQRVTLQFLNTRELTVYITARMTFCEPQPMVQEVEGAYSIYSVYDKFVEI